MRSEYAPLFLLTLINLAVLLYWLLIWLKSYHGHRDAISLLVLLFVLQSVLSEAWVALAVWFSVSGQAMQNMVLHGNYAIQIMVIVILTAIQYFVLKLEQDDKNGG